MKRPALENVDVRSQSTSARCKSAFNWTPKLRDVSDWAGRIDHLLTPYPSTTRFEATPEFNGIVTSHSIATHETVLKC